LGRIEFEFFKAIEDRRECVRGGASDAARLEIERDLQLDVLDVDDAVARPLRFNIVRLKRTPDPIEKRDEGRFISKLIRHCEAIEKARLVHDENVGERSLFAQCRYRS